jgi:site-specific DNA-methyltransferase (adenine-specific)
MRLLPDKCFDLVLSDPPYGLDVSNWDIVKPSRPNHTKMVDNGYEKYSYKGWDKEIPKKEYFEQLLRVSKNQIIWGGNYFTDYLPPKKAWVYWRKGADYENSFNFSHGELAWTSFDKQLLSFHVSPKSETNGGKDRIHVCQKPVALYRWLLRNYAKPGDTIFDSHMGSQSSRIACHMEGFDFTGCELDPEYFEQGNQRYETFLKAFGTPDPEKAIPGQQINLF